MDDVHAFKNYLLASIEYKINRLQNDKNDFT
jgi:hypothetical protein